MPENPTIKFRLLKPFGMQKEIGTILEYRRVIAEKESSSAQWLLKNGYIEEVKEE